MPKKPTKPKDQSSHIRIDPGLSGEIDILREGFEVKVSRAAFVEGLIRRGIVNYKKENGTAVVDGKLVCSRQ